MAVVIAFNKKHKAGTEPKRLMDTAPAPMVAEPTVKPEPEILLPTTITTASNPATVAFFVKLFSAFLTLGKKAGLDFSDDNVRRDFVFGLHCFQAAILRQSGHERHPLHAVLAGTQTTIDIPKYLKDHTPH